jgi:hypothetical protein
MQVVQDQILEVVVEVELEELESTQIQVQEEWELQFIVLLY